MAKNQFVDEADDKKEAAKKAKVEAKARILAFVKENAGELGPQLVADFNMFVKLTSTKGPRMSKSINSELRDAFVEKKSLTEMDIFKQFKIGRPEMTTKIRILVLCPNPADRVWVKFDEASETYNVEGLGENPPKDWEGYVPASKTDDL